MIKDRIFNIRKVLHLSQESFGNRLGVTGASISRIEKGERNITEQMILAICREYNVREEWLRNGEGDMFLDFTEDEFARAATSLSSDPLARSILMEYWKLDDDNRKLFRGFLERLVDGMRGQVSKQEAAPAVDRPVREMTREELHAALDRQLDAEKEAAAKSEAS